jgi:hypothetical protein
MDDAIGASGTMRTTTGRGGFGLLRIAGVLGLFAFSGLACTYSSVAAGGSGPLPGFACASLAKGLYPAADAAVRYMTARVLVGRENHPPIFLAVCGGEPPDEILSSVEGFGILPISRAELFDAPSVPSVVIDRESGTQGVLMNIVGFRCATDRACKLEVVYGGKHSILDLEMYGDHWSVSEDRLEPNLVRNAIEGAGFASSRPAGYGFGAAPVR